MTTNPTRSAAQAIVDEVGGPDNIESLTHCATRLRFQLRDGSKADAAKIDQIPGVMGAVPQAGDRFQVVIGGAVQSVYSDIMSLPSMAKSGAPAPQSDADVKAAARSKARGKVWWLDAFFEYLSDSFRPLLGVLLGASLIIAFTAVLDALGLVDFRAADKPAAWVFVDAMWRAVFYFLPIMVAYNAAKKLNIDPWVGATIMGALMTPEFIKMNNPDGGVPGVVCTVNQTLGTNSCIADVFGIPLQLNDYSGQVFVPLIMVALLAPLYHGLKRLIPENVQMVFVPFLSMAIMIPVTAFLLGPLGVWLGNGLGFGLSWLNNSAPIVFAILIPLIYPFLVPLGLHWPLNALMLINIKTLGYDFIQGPMGAWNFACFGATAGVLVLAMREKDVQMRQTATGALAAGLFGGISEPSLYGIHLRFKRIYPRMLVGCLTGGVIIGLLGATSGGVKTTIFAFTSLLTIPVFNPMWIYAIAIAAAFFVSMFLVIVSGYKDPVAVEQLESPMAGPELLAPHGAGAAEASAAPVTAPAAAAVDAHKGEQVIVGSPLAGQVIPITEVEDKVFASKTLGDGVGIRPSERLVYSPVTGKVATVTKTGHAFGIKTDSGVEVLVHVGIDTVQMKGDGFDVAVTKGQEVQQGDLLVTVDFDKVRAAGFDTTTVVSVTNTKAMTSVTPITGDTVAVGAPIIDVTR